jgi:hypothetical protein
VSMRRVSATHWQHLWRVSDAELLEADVVPTGIAVGAHYEWLNGGHLKWLTSSLRVQWNA